MAIDRAEALKNAEKLLRQGKLDQAIEEYTRVVDEQPTDWNTRNTLGDLLARAGQSERAALEFVRIADAFKRDGFYAKAAALYRKVLKIKPDDEHALFHGADVAASQGLLADARAGFSALRERYRARGDRQSELQITVTLGAIDPADHDARVHGATALVALGDMPAAMQALRALSDDLTEKRQFARQIDVLSQLLGLAIDADANDRVLDAQARLVDAHLANGTTDDALLIAEDLVARHPDEEPHVERLTRVFQALGRSDVDETLRRLRHPEADAPPEPPVVDVSRLPAPDVVVSETSVGPPPVDTGESAETPVATEIVTATVAQARHRSKDVEIDLSVVLDEIRKPPTQAPAPAAAATAPDLDDVFAQMRDEARRRLAVESAEQDYRRGIALFQAGQVEDAIAALQTAAAVPRFRFECSALLGRIFLNRGDLASSIEWLDRAVEAPASSPAALHKALYNLADALESSGQTARALAALVELQAAAGAFRDVASRIKRLTTLQSRG